MAEELQAVLHEQHRLDEQIATVQQQLSQLDHWLKAHDPATLDYQEQVETWLGLQAHLADLSAQAACLEEAVRQLRAGEREEEHGFANDDGGTPPSPQGR
jgi:chromosome segregation ATPase